MSASVRKREDPPSLADASSLVKDSISLGLRQRRNAKSAAEALKRQSTSHSASPPESTSSCCTEKSPNPGDNQQPHAFVESLMGGLRPAESTKFHGIAIETMDRHFRYLTIWLLCTWLSLVTIMYLLIPRENIVRLSGLEQRAAIMGMSLIFVSLFSRIIELLGMGGGLGGPHSSYPKHNGSKGFFHGLWKVISHNISGILLGGLAVQVVALATDFLMVFFPTPVVIDPVLGTRVHVLRWCEWFPCTAFMTFMMEGADLYWPIDNDGTVSSDTMPRDEQQQETQVNLEHGPPPDFLRKKYKHAATQGGAVFLGLLFPFCPGFKTWVLCVVTAVVLYLTNYPRMRERRRQIPLTLRDGATVEEAERYNSAISALRLRYACTAVWSFIVASYFVSGIIGPKFASEGSFLLDPAASMVIECLSDVLSKVLFSITLLDVHYAIFDPFARSERRLEELRRLMNAVWESSSDSIAISVRAGPSGGVSTLLSPAFFGLGGGKGPFRRMSKQEITDLFHHKSLLFQLSQHAFLVSKDNTDNHAEEHRVGLDDILNVEYTEFSTAIGQSKGVMIDGREVLPDIRALAAISECIVKAWEYSGHDQVFTHKLKWTREDNNQEIVIHSETKVSRLDENSLIVIIRDISQRVKVFEKEKVEICEATSRKKDADANRFTRHEVKNGLLAAIGLYETLCDAQRFQLSRGHHHNSGTSSFDLSKGEADDNVVKCMNELGKSLHETLDVIMVEAMTRDLMHDLYKPRREWVDVSAILKGRCDFVNYEFQTGGNMTRFPLITRPSPLPSLYFDPILLRVMHRQVLSNACKFGLVSGTILTEIIYNENERTLQIKVFNMPGPHHKELVAMGARAEDAVFGKGTQIHGYTVTDTDSEAWSKQSESVAVPGEGGWIIRKCAKAMKGDCSIHFEESRTVFTVKLPAKPHNTSKTKAVIDFKPFRLPHDIWGIAIDDSKIQQKLLGKFFEFAGIPSERQYVFGKNSEEIMTFVDFVLGFMAEHKGEPVLLVVDENLDVLDEAARHKTISGSQLVESIRALLLPEQERVLISLIRSANDAATDIAIYKARAHGFLPKVPLKKENVLETLSHLWNTRYPLRRSGPDEDSTSLSLSASRARTESFSSIESEDTSHEIIASTPIDILMAVKEMNKLLQNVDVRDDWGVIKDKLHALKGDLLTLHDSSKAIAAVGVINSLRDFNSHEEFLERWHMLRDQVMALSSS